MRVLLIEDDRMIGSAVQQALRDAAYAVDWVTDGEAAVHAAESETYELVLLDLGLPKADGRDVLRRLRLLGRKLPVIIVTARDSVEDRIDGLDLGADDYLIKPFEIRELLARMRAVLRREGSGSAALLSNGKLSLDPATREAKFLGEKRTAECARVRAPASAVGAAGHDPVAGRARTADLRLERGGREQRHRVPDPHRSQEARSRGDPQRARRGVDGGARIMIGSLRGRLFVGLTAMIVLTGGIGGIFAYRWAFDEAIEIQDSALIQIASLAQNGSFNGGQAVSRRLRRTRRSG